MNPLHELLEHGQSYWLDNLTRGMIQSGELGRRVREAGLRGVTSNPAIFNKAISSGHDYDEQIGVLVREGVGIGAIYEELAVTDIRGACDVLRPVWDESEGVDGYVSLEVSPYLAHDADATIEEACRLNARVDRPNVFIKIPGTAAAVPAIEACLYKGVNINVTLLFSIESYEAVALAYMRALERRLQDGRPLDEVASVASFFLSRIDVLTDRLLGQRISPGGEREPRPERLLGRAAVANAKLAYQRFLELTAGERWQTLAESGARPQRMLWASTSTKNPLYDDIRYVEPLIGPDTVNTMPNATIDAFADHGHVATTVTEEVEEAERMLAELAEVGIDFERVTWQLENEGVQKFIDPFDQLMETIAERMRVTLGEIAPAATMELGGAAGGVEAALTALDDAQFGQRVYARDASIWNAWEPADARAIRDRLGWLDAVDTFSERASRIADFAASARDDGIRHVVLLGMGGSSLSAEVARQTFGAREGWPELLVLDSTDPEAVREVEGTVELASALFLVASKSGTTQETISFYRYFWERVKDEVAGEPGSHFVAITDPGTPLAEEAKERGFRACFENPPDIGGRYSVLSYFGLVPMALAGVPVGELLERARLMRKLCGPSVPAPRNPGARLGAALAMLARGGRDKVTFLASTSLSSFGLWAEQLLAESTGKDGRGLIPVAGEPSGDPSEYGSDRVFVWLGLAGEEEGEMVRRLDRLAERHPVIRFQLPDRLALGGEFFRWEFAVATAGAVLGVNPFDQPNVEESKRNTREVLGTWVGGEGPAGEGSAVPADQGPVVPADEALNTIRARAKPGDYVALLPYFAESSGRDAALGRLRSRIRAESGVATTLGYGPRYLHSTGQLHKGGPASGIFLILTADPAADIEIPGGEGSFGRLLLAQALGDYRSLAARGRRVSRIHLGADVEAGLARLVGEARHEREPVGHGADSGS
ncbi:MAG: bifunctional transaldolase/phosoglucose isomerase [Gemmatimonadetes bacterium]|nr:bifunctional transaldolase/phosoglucose isomerase [Gemmatimonadota bacterium]